MTCLCQLWTLIHPKVRNVTLRNVTSLLYPQSLWNIYDMFFLVVTKGINQRNQTSCLRTSRSVIIVIITMLTLYYSTISQCYTSSLPSCIYVDSTYLINITCTWVDTSMILGRLECTYASQIRFLILKGQPCNSEVVIGWSNPKFIQLLKICAELEVPTMTGHIPHKSIDAWRMF